MSAQPISLDSLPLGEEMDATFTSAILWDDSTPILWDDLSAIEWGEATITPSVIELK